MITREMIHREQRLAAIANHVRTLEIQEGRGRTTIEAEEMRDFCRHSAGVRRLAFYAAVGTTNSTIEIEENESVDRRKLLESESPEFFKIVSCQDRSMTEAYDRWENRERTYKIFEDLLTNEQDLAFCELCHDQRNEQNKMAAEMEANLKKCLLMGQWRIERREECDVRWRLEEEEVVALQEIVDDIEFMLQAQDFVMISEKPEDLANKRTKYGYLFKRYKILDEEKEFRNFILQDEEGLTQSSLVPELRLLNAEVDDELRKLMRRVARTMSSSSTPAVPVSRVPSSADGSKGKKNITNEELHRKDIRNKSPDAIVIYAKHGESFSHDNTNETENIFMNDFESLERQNKDFSARASSSGSSSAATASPEISQSKEMKRQSEAREQSEMNLAISLPTTNSKSTAAQKKFGFAVKNNQNDRKNEHNVSKSNSIRQNEFNETMEPHRLPSFGSESLAVIAVAETVSDEDVESNVETNKLVPQSPTRQEKKMNLIRRRIQDAWSSLEN